MNDAALVNVLQALADLHEALHAARLVGRPDLRVTALQIVAQRRGLAELHLDQQRLAVRPLVEQRRRLRAARRAQRRGVVRATCRAVAAIAAGRAQLGRRAAVHHTQRRIARAAAASRAAASTAATRAEQRAGGAAELACAQLRAAKHLEGRRRADPLHRGPRLGRPAAKVVGGGGLTHVD